MLWFIIDFTKTDQLPWVCDLDCPNTMGIQLKSLEQSLDSLYIWGLIKKYHDCCHGNTELKYIESGHLTQINFELCHT